jgi:hypothetical protein
MKNNLWKFATVVVVLTMLMPGLMLLAGCGPEEDAEETPPQIIKRSVSQGDEVYDSRSPVEACNSLIKDIQDSNPTLNCQLIDSKRIDSGEGVDSECVDGASIAGCFSCTFECK